MTPASLLKFGRVPPAWIVPSIALAWALDRWLPIAEWLPVPWNILLAGVAWACSLALTGSAARRLASHHTTIYPNGESTVLVTDGLYRYTRNPMYLGMALLVAGVALFLGSLSALLSVVFFCLAVQQIFIIPEERRLESWFGEDFRSYRLRVRRWI